MLEEKKGFPPVFASAAFSYLDVFLGPFEPLSPVYLDSFSVRQRPLSCTPLAFYSEPVPS